VPSSVTVFFLTHFKFQYWLPVALPLFSSLGVLLPEKWHTGGAARISRFAQIAVLSVVLVQFILFVRDDIQRFDKRVHRSENSTSIQFYDQVVGALKPLPDGQLHLYYDYRMYMPGTPGWVTETNFDLLEYGYIQEHNFDVLLLTEQRIRDYLNPDVKGIDPELFARNQQFYRDADNEMISGYHLVYRDSFGLVYVRNDLYQHFFSK